MLVSTLTPQSPSYRGKRSVHGLDRVLPHDWLADHEFANDELEVYAFGEALVLLPSRDAQPKLGTDFFKQLTVGWCPVDWWRIGIPGKEAEVVAPVDRVARRG